VQHFGLFRLYLPGQPVDQDQQRCRVRGNRPGGFQHKLALHLAHGAVVVGGNRAVVQAGIIQGVVESLRESAIGLANGALQPPAPPVKTDDLFADGFETGDLSAWSVSVTDNGSLSASAQAAITGSYGLQATINDSNSIYILDWGPYEETRYRARFYFDPNSITMAHGDAHYLFYAANRDGVVVGRVEFRFSAGDYQVRAEAVNDATAWSSSPWVTITDGPHALEIDWQAASAVGANNGRLAFWVDNIQQANITTIDNDTRRMDCAYLGAVAGVDAGTSPLLYKADETGRPCSTGRRRTEHRYSKAQ